MSQKTHLKTHTGNLIDPHPKSHKIDKQTPHMKSHNNTQTNKTKL